MRFLCLLIAVFLPFAASAATADFDDVTAKNDCITEKGFTRAQLTRGTFIEIIRECSQEKRKVWEQSDVYRKAELERKELIEKATKSFQARFRGRDPTAHVLPKAQEISRVKKVTRVSPRARRASALDLKSTTQKPQGE